MTNEELRDEIRENRVEISNLAKEFYIFKGKAFGFISLLTILINLASTYLFK